MSEHRDIMNPYTNITTSTTTAPVPATAGAVSSISHLSHPHTAHTTQPPATHLSTGAAPATDAAATATAPAPSTTVSDSSSQSEEMQCQWHGCSDRCSSAEALYDHICERHVGRKSTNNLNLTCHWGHCRTTTVKRDHITSHIRVHVPLKPHKCDFCGKSFKRPQDLKKHVKTHADDSVLVRSPEPHSRHPDLSYQTNGRGYGAPAHYYEQSSMNPVVSQGYTNGATHYYQAHPSLPSHPSSHHNSSAYGSVYYTLNPGGADGDSYGNRKRAFDALNEFFGDVKRRQFDPASYAAVGQRMHGLHSLNLPLLNGPMAVPDYQQSIPAAVPSLGGGGYGSGPATQAAVAAPSYQLPPMSNVRTKSDLINIDQFLEQMQNTIYESEEHVAAAGLGQPGAQYISGAMGHHTRPSHSPPTHHASAAASHSYGAGTATSYSSASSGPTIASMTSAHSPGSSGTPALTPPSSAQSYTSGRSPVSSTSTSHRAMPLHDSGANLYPRLPSHRDGMTTAAAGYHPATSGAGAPSTLGGHYDYDERRRYMGGTLQRARPSDRESVDPMDTSRDSDGDAATDGDRTPRAKEGSVEMGSPKRVSPGVIDPSLHPDASPKASDAAAAAAAELAQGTFSHLADTMRIIDRLRELVADWLREGTFDEKQENRAADSGRLTDDGGQEDDPMDGVESQRSPDREEETRQHPKEVTKVDADDSTRLYPTLRALVDDDDGDARPSGVTA